MNIKTSNWPRYLPLILATTGLLLLSSCTTTGPQNISTSPGPDRIEMANQSEVNAELDKVFRPIDEKSELLNP